MRNFSNLTAGRLLDIQSPELLFSPSHVEAKAEYRLLAKTWHPDRVRSEEATRVFAHIAALYEECRTKLSNGEWTEPPDKIEDLIAGVRTFKLWDGSCKTCKYRTMRSFELGRAYVCDHSVAYEIEHEHAEFFENGRKRIHLPPFKNNAMAFEMSKYLPQIKQTFRTSGSNILVLRKTPDQLLLADVLNHLKHGFEPIEHIGWIINNLLNLACYLEWAGLTHNAISPHTITISPLRHNAMLLGGWWYATKCGEQLKAVPDRTVSSIPPDILRSGKVDIRVDLDSIKSTARESLAGNKTIPPALQDWLAIPAGDRAIDEYKHFKHEVLPNAFGAPKFIQMSLTADQLYKEE